MEYLKNKIMESRHFQGKGDYRDNLIHPNDPETLPNFCVILFISTKMLLF